MVRVGISVTNKQIEMFWTYRRMKEEEHLLAAQKAAARIKARALMERYLAKFEDPSRLSSQIVHRVHERGNGRKEQIDNTNNGIAGIQNWWTESSYAYLNQPPYPSLTAKHHF